MTEQSVVSVVALEVSDGRESEFLTLTGRMQAMVRRKGYGTNQLLRDGSNDRRYYDIRIWRNAEAAASAEADREIRELRREIANHLHARPIVDIAWAVEVGLTAAGPWQERRVQNDRRTSAERRVQELPFAGHENRLGGDRRIGPRRMDDAASPHPDVVQAARTARDKAAAPFSNFKVGAAIQAADGRVFTGCNVENATYGLTMCAERVALFKAISEGYRSFTRVAVVADMSQPTTPCGACRQVLWEFAGDIEVLVADLRSVRTRHQLRELLPHPFDARFIE